MEYNAVEILNLSESYDIAILSLSQETELSPLKLGNPIKAKKGKLLQLLEARLD